MGWLSPKDKEFEQHFRALAQVLHEASLLLKQILENMDGVDMQVQQLSAIEHRADDITHTIFTKLNQTFITPFDREDIHKLATSLDDVVDLIYASGNCLSMYEISERCETAVQIAHVIVAQATQLVGAMDDLQRVESLHEHCKEINRLENEADSIYRQAMGGLFKTERDPIKLIKLKELHEALELATDKAEDAANVLETIMVKSA